MSLLSPRNLLNFAYKALFLTILFLGVSLPICHHKWLRDYVGKRVVKITDQSGNSGGTGFYIKLPSGKTSILTNSHVCDLQKAGIIFISDDSSIRQPHNIIINSAYTDLCLVAGDEVHGLSLAPNAPFGEIVYELGHPLLNALTMTQGELIGRSRVKTGTHITNAYDTNIISLPGNSGSPVVDFYGRVVGVIFATDTEEYWGSTVSLEDINKFVNGF